jgi:uncharacterized protein YndB with AHSA1/START domain
MKENKITIIIDKPIEEVFKFTTNPKNTHLWIPSIKEEVSEEYPPRIGTKYKNRGKDYEWDYYTVIELEENKVFTLIDSMKNYFVRYSYKELGDNETELEYFEWVKEGSLENPFTKEILKDLKEIMESKTTQ